MKQANLRTPANLPSFGGPPNWTGQRPVLPGVALLALALCLLAAIPFSDFTVAGNVFRFVPLLLLAGVAYFFAARQFRFAAAGIRPRLFWWVAIALRLLVLPMSPGDDLWRYLWEGRLQWHGLNPYLLAPDAPSLLPLRDAVWVKMNHHGYAAIYPPGAELMLKYLTLGGGSIWLMKVVFALADLGVAAILLRVNPGQARHRDAVWYAWNPLVIYSFAGAAHFDSMMLFALMLAVYGLFRADPMNNRPAHWGWAMFSALALGAAISIKLLPLVLLPVFALALRSRAIVLPLAGLIPWVTALAYGFPQNDLFKSFRDFGYVTRFNDFLWWISERLIWPNPEQKNGLYTLIAMAMTLLASLLAGRDWRKGLLWTLGAVLIFSTVVHPWYVTWILPFAALRRARGWFVLSATIFLAFLWWETTPLWKAWAPSPLLSLAIALPPLVVAGWVIFRRFTVLWKSRIIPT